MKETLLLAVTAHLVADFLLQPNWLASRKRNAWFLLLHAAIVGSTAAALLGQWFHPLLLWITVSHLAIDAGKTYLTSDGLRSFLLDQGLHLAAVLAGAIAFPGAVPDGLWFQVLADAEQRAWLLRAATVASGLILCLPVGGILVSKTVKPLLSAEQFHQMKGVPNGGRIIGYLERSLVMLLIWIGQPAGIGFLVTAKSILRFGDIKDSENRQITEYVIIGTFLSFGWAILTSTLVQVVWGTW
jgi:hypothetical protein